MIQPVKHKAHLDAVWRTPPERSTRLDKLRLDKNERVSPFPAEFWQELLSDISQAHVQAYPEVRPLYEEVACHHGLTPEHFLLTAGSDAAIRHCFEAFVSPGDRVVFPDPTFAMVSVYSELYGANGLKIGYDRDLRLDIPLLLASLNEEVSLVVLANPNSPTGTFIARPLIVQILQQAGAFGIPVMIDEAYHGFCPHTVIDLVETYPNLIVTRSFSKVAGLAGMRVGYAVATPETISILGKFRPMYEVNALGLLFATRALRHWEHALDYGERTIAGRERLLGELAGMGFPVVSTATNFIHVDFGRLKERVTQHLEEIGILARGMLRVPGYENFTRISVGPWETMAPFMEAVNRVIASEA